MAIHGRRRGNLNPCICCDFSCRPRDCRWLPVLLVASHCAVMYYVYILIVCFMLVHDEMQRLVYLAVLHFFMVMNFWCYIRAILTHPKEIPEQYCLLEGDLRLIKNTEEKARKQLLEQLAVKLPISQRTSMGFVKVCYDCCILKPDRCHHCSVCERCVPKMDHHCPLINNCVSYTNYKFFMLSTFYFFLLHLQFLGTSAQYIWDILRRDTPHGNFISFQLIITFTLALIIALNILKFLHFHYDIIFRNRTTIDKLFSRERKNDFDLGCWKNFKQVFGGNCILWFLPIFTSEGDGIVFPVNIQPKRKLVVQEDVV